MFLRGWCFEGENGAGAGVSAPADSGDSLVGSTSVEEFGAGIEPAGGKVAPAAAAVAPAETVADGLSLRAFLEPQYELPADVTDAELQRLLQAEISAGEQARGFYEQVAPVWQQIAPHQAEFQEWLKTRGQPGQPAQTVAAQVQVEPAKPKLTAPEYREEWRAMVAPDPTQPGRFVPRNPASGAAIQAAEGMNRFATHREQLGQRLATDPFGLVKDAGLEEYIAEREAALEKKLFDKFHQEIEQRQLASASKRLETRLRENMYDAQGQLNGYGQKAVEQFAVWCDANGVQPNVQLPPDAQVAAWDFVERRLDAMQIPAAGAAGAAAGSSSPAAAKPAAPRRRFTDGTAYGPPRNEAGRPDDGATANRVAVSGIGAEELAVGAGEQHIDYHWEQAARKNAAKSR